MEGWLFLAGGCFAFCFLWMVKFPMPVYYPNERFWKFQIPPMETMDVIAMEWYGRSFYTLLFAFAFSLMGPVFTKMNIRRAKIADAGVVMIAFAIILYTWGLMGEWIMALF